MKKTFTICVLMITIFASSCARSYYKEPAFEKEVATHNGNNIFN